MYDPYEILGVEKGADKKTIKQAYAKLVKQYHPEDNPEEWKRIHDAYELVMKIASEQKQKPAVALGTTDLSQQSDEVVEIPEEYTQEWDLTSAVNIPQPKEPPSIPVGNPVETHKMQKADQETLFGEVEEIAMKQREEEEKALESASDEIQQLAWNKKFEKTAWKEFFDRENLLPIISQKKFLRALGDCFAYNQIDLTLYRYLNRQIEMIAEYIKEHNVDMTRSQDLSAVKYAKEKVRLAYKRYAEAQREQWEKRIAICIVPVAIVIVVIWALAAGWTEQRKEKKEEQSHIEEIITDWQNELRRRPGFRAQPQDIYILE